MHKLGQTNTIEISKVLSGIPGFRGCFSKDELPSKRLTGYYVINMQNHDDGNGTHFVALHCGVKKCEYFDPFGYVPPKQVIKYCEPLDLSFNPYSIQDIDAKSCGFFSIYWIDQMAKGRKSNDIAEDFNFDENKLKQNDRQLLNDKRVRQLYESKYCSAGKGLIDTLHTSRLRT
jgi:hypothetical protein